MVLIPTLDDPIIGQRYTQNYTNLNGDHYLILDNGAHEAQTAHIKFILGATSQLGNINEIVMPDAQQDPNETISMTISTVNWLMTDAGVDAYTFAGSPTLQYVPQGNNLLEWLRCLEVMMEEHHKLRSLGLYPSHPVIGIAKKHANISPHFHQEACNIVRNYCGPDCAIHLMGWPVGVDVPRLIDLFPYIRSIDTAKPFTLALEGVDASQYMMHIRKSRPDQYFRYYIQSDRTLQLVESNIEVFKRICEGRGE